MARVAVVSREPTLELSEWSTTLAMIPELRPSQPRLFRNPFTNKDEMSQPQPDEVDVHDGDESVGSIVPDEEFYESGELHVYASGEPSPTLRRVVEDVASRLGANVEWEEL